MAEGLMNHLGRGRFKAYSAGSHPTGKVQPLALQTLSPWHIPTDGFSSKSWDEFAVPGGPENQQQRAYMDAALALKRRIELMLALPLQTLAGMSLQREIERIGKTGAA
jgi:protein-tyrosine-phosphatase